MTETLYGDKDFELYYEEMGGHVFIHLDIHNWSKSVCQRIRAMFEATLLYFDTQGRDVIFATTQNPQAVKVWNTIKTHDEIVELKHGNRPVGWLGAWYTGEE